jgi:hypothetical protein
VSYQDELIAISFRPEAREIAWRPRSEPPPGEARGSRAENVK